MRLRIGTSPYPGIPDLREYSHNLEVRDAFFTRLRDRIEQNKRLSGRKTVLISHSMGGSVILYFL